MDDLAWVRDWQEQLGSPGDHVVWSREIVVLAAGFPEEFRELVARALGLPIGRVASVFGCAATEEYLMAAQHPVDVVVVSPLLRWSDVLPMAEFTSRSYPDTGVVVVRHPWDAPVDAGASDGPVDAVLDTLSGPVGLLEAVLRVTASGHLVAPAPSPWGHRMGSKAPLARCGECPLSDGRFVPGDGPDKADIVIVGEAPGWTETVEGKPFVGPAGARLDKELAAIGIARPSVYITNTVLCHPEGNRTPPAAAVRACHQRLVREIRRRWPKKILALGTVATRAVTGKSGTIRELRRMNPLPSRFLDADVRVVVTYHPAAVLRNPGLGPHFSSDIRGLLDP